MIFYMNKITDIVDTKTTFVHHNHVHFSCIALDRFWKIHKQEIHLRKFKIIREAQFIF